MLTGKNRLNYHMYNIGYTYSKECDYCSQEGEGKRKLGEEEDETANHILISCPTFSAQRQQIFGCTDLKNYNLSESNGIKSLLNKIIKFFDKTDVMSRPNKYEKWQLSPPKKKVRR